MFEFKKNEKNKRLNEVLRHPVAGVMPHSTTPVAPVREVNTWNPQRKSEFPKWELIFFGFKLKGFRFNLLKSGIVYSFIMILTLS